MRGVLGQRECGCADEVGVDCARKSEHDAAEFANEGFLVLGEGLQGC